MGVPHYSRIIKGKAVSRGPEYGDRQKMEEGSGTEGDETEDLYLLLKNIMVSFCRRIIGICLARLS